jgi:hypothetical protein
MNRRYPSKDGGDQGQERNNIEDTVQATPRRSSFSSERRPDSWHTARMKSKTVYLVLAVLGAAIPYHRFLPWLLEHGLDLPLFFHQLHANPVSEFFAARLGKRAVSWEDRWRSELSGRS